MLRESPENISLSSFPCSARPDSPTSLSRRVSVSSSAVHAVAKASVALSRSIRVGLILFAARTSAALLGMLPLGNLESSRLKASPKAAKTLLKSSERCEKAGASLSKRVSNSSMMPSYSGESDGFSEGAAERVGVSCASRASMRRASSFPKLWAAFRKSRVFGSKFSRG